MSAIRSCCCAAPSTVAAAAPSQQQLRRSSTIQSSTQMVVSLCVYLLEVLLSAPRGGTRRHLEDRDASCCGRAAAAPSQQQQQATAVSRDDERSTGDFLLRVDGSFSFESVTRSHHSRPPSLLLLLQLFTQPIFSLERAGCHSPCGGRGGDLLNKLLGLVTHRSCRTADNTCMPSALALVRGMERRRQREFGQHACVARLQATPRVAAERRGRKWCIRQIRRSARRGATT